MDPASLPLAELKRLYEQKEREHDELREEIEELEARLLDKKSKLAALTGATTVQSTASQVAVATGASLPSMIEAILKRHSGGQTCDEVLRLLATAGWTTKSDKPRNLVYQALHKMVSKGSALKAGKKYILK